MVVGMPMWSAALAGGNRHEQVNCVCLTMQAKQALESNPMGSQQVTCEGKLVKKGLWNGQAPADYVG